MTSRAEAEAMDGTDRLAHLRKRFILAPGVIYLDGNSLGPLQHRVVEELGRVTEGEWGEGLIRSWNTAGWMDLPQRLGDRIAPLIGASPGEVICADSVSVNLFKLIGASLSMRPGRQTVLSEHENFPTDLYIAQGAVEALAGKHRLKLVEREALPGALDEEVALLMLTHVDFRTGALHDMAALTEKAHAAGAMVLWDLSHSAGALPVNLAAVGADFAVGGTYKFLNGGPGAPAFLYVASRHQERAMSPITGWMGHASPFDFAEGYIPAAGISRFAAGTPGILGMTAAMAAMEIWDDVSIDDVRRKSMALTSLFIELVEERLAGQGFVLASPIDPALRGSQVSFRHPHGYAIMQALGARGVIGDFRAPDLLRFGFAPLYTRFVDAWDAVEQLAAVVERREFADPKYQERAAVT